LHAVVHYEDIGTRVYRRPCRSCSIAGDPCRRDIREEKRLVSNVASIMLIFVDTNWAL
jgi:hypothetical protein